MRSAQSSFRNACFYVFKREEPNFLNMNVYEFKSKFPSNSFNIILILFEVNFNVQIKDLDTFLLENLELFLDRTHKIVYENKTFRLVLISEINQNPIESLEN